MRNGRGLCMSVDAMHRVCGWTTVAGHLLAVAVSLEGHEARSGPMTVAQCPRLGMALDGPFRGLATTHIGTCSHQKMGILAHMNHPNAGALSRDADTLTLGATLGMRTIRVSINGVSTRSFRGH